MAESQVNEVALQYMVDDNSVKQTNRYKAYPEYKDSGVKWLGDIPSGWDAVPLKYICANPVKDGPHETPTFIDEGIPFLSVDGIQNNKLVFESCRFISTRDHKKYSRKCKPVFGDVLLGKAASVGKVAFVDTHKEFNVWSPLAVITPKKTACGKFIFYAFQSNVLQAQCDVYSNSNTQKNLGMNTIDNLMLPAPSYEEQNKIANFLDYETTKIDTLIEKQQRLIELLTEKRQAVISHAVTKGLNPDVPMKDSGVEWLGKVPEHWEVKPLKYLIRAVKGAVKAGPFGSHLKNSDMQDEDIKVITQKNVITKDINIGDSFISSKKYQELQTFKIFKKDLLITTRGTIGRTLVYDKDDIAILHPCLIRIQLDESKANTHLMSLIIQESGYALEQILINSNATTIEVIYSDNLINTVIAVPESLEEQIQILNFIKSKKFEFDELISRGKNAIQLMQERRTALISAAVTGKIDVRDWEKPE